MYDLNGNLLGKLAAGGGSLPISFKNLVEASGGQTSSRTPAKPERRFLHPDVPGAPTVASGTKSPAPGLDRRGILTSAFAGGWVGRPSQS